MALAVLLVCRLGGSFSERLVSFVVRGLMSTPAVGLEQRGGSLTRMMNLALRGAPSLSTFITGRARDPRSARGFYCVRSALHVSEARLVGSGKPEDGRMGLATLVRSFLGASFFRCRGGRLPSRLRLFSRRCSGRPSSRLALRRSSAPFELAFLTSRLLGANNPDGPAPDDAKERKGK